MPTVIRAVVYYNEAFRQETANQAMELLRSEIEKHSEKGFTLEWTPEPEGIGHQTNNRVELGDDDWAIGVHTPPEGEKPTSEFTSSINFSSTLRYTEDSTSAKKVLQGVGGPHDCCININNALSVPALVHEFLHTLQSQQINGNIVPSVDDNWWYKYPGWQEDNEERGWSNWFVALLSGNWGPQLAVKRSPQ